jgi:phosphomannomutase
MIFKSSIFKAYDIRGIYGIDFDDDFAYQLGLAYSQLRREELGRSDLKIVVGHDMRISSPVLQAELIKGLVAGGVEVIDIGLVSTPTFYFAVAHYHYDGGIQVSASHNPKEYNGFKLVRQLASPIGENSGINDLKNLMLSGEIFPYSVKGKVAQQNNVLADQVIYDVSTINISDIKPCRVVFDTANAMGALYFDELFKQIPQMEVIRMNWVLDGTFPAHEADPYKTENVLELCDKVKTEKADMGVATDGDADRIFFIDNEGEAIEPGITRAILAQIFLAEKPHTTIAYDIRPGRITYDTIIAQGGSPLVTRVGHSLIKEAMIDAGVYFAGESSGHFFLNMEKEGCYEIPGIVFLKLLVELSKEKKTLVEYSKPFKKYSHSGEINLTVTNGQEKIAALKEKYRDGEQNELDGLSVEYQNYWFNVRLSHTEPLLRLNVEAVSREIMEEKKLELLNFLKK